MLHIPADCPLHVGNLGGSTPPPPSHQILFSMAACRRLTMTVSVIIFRNCLRYSMAAGPRLSKWDMICSWVVGGPNLSVVALLHHSTLDNALSGSGLRTLCTCLAYTAGGSTIHLHKCKALTATAVGSTVRLLTCTASKVSQPD